MNKPDNEAVQDPAELFNRLIDSNRENMQSMNELTNALNNLSPKLEQIEIFELSLEKIEQSFSREQRSRTDFLSKIPTKLETELSDKSKEMLENLDKNGVNAVKFQLISLAIIGLTALILAISISGTLKFYGKSILSKEELRHEIISDFVRQNKVLADKAVYIQLQRTDQSLRAWIEKNPRDSEKYLQFEQGFNLQSNKK